MFIPHSFPLIYLATMTSFINANKAVFDLIWLIWEQEKGWRERVCDLTLVPLGQVCVRVGLCVCVCVGVGWFMLCVTWRDKAWHVVRRWGVPSELDPTALRAKHISYRIATECGALQPFFTPKVCSQSVIYLKRQPEEAAWRGSLKRLPWPASSGDTHREVMSGYGFSYITLNTGGSASLSL